MSSRFNNNTDHTLYVTRKLLMSNQTVMDVCDKEINVLNELQSYIYDLWWLTLWTSHHMDFDDLKNAADLCEVCQRK